VKIDGRTVRATVTQLTLNEMKEVSGGNLWAVLAAGAAGVSSYLYASQLNDTSVTGCGILGSAAGGMAGYGGNLVGGVVLGGITGASTYTTVKEYCEAYTSH
jgi:hypothetical protein